MSMQSKWADAKLCVLLFVPPPFMRVRDGFRHFANSIKAMQTIKITAAEREEMPQQYQLSRCLHYDNFMGMRDGSSVEDSCPVADLQCLRISGGLPSASTDTGNIEAPSLTADYCNRSTHTHTHTFVPRCALHSAVTSAAVTRKKCWRKSKRYQHQ